MELRRMTTLQVFLLVAVVPTLSVPPGQVCQKPTDETSSCVCLTKNGIVDLRPVSSNKGDARYTGLEDGNNYVYEYNPCFPFSTIGECQNVHMCQESKDTSDTYKIADAGTERIYVDSDGDTEKLTAFYTSSNFLQDREVYVYLTCDKSVKDPIVTTTGDTKETLTYEVSFTSCQACPGGCGGGGAGESKAGIIGIVLIILLIVGFATYFVVGTIIMGVRFNKTGSEMIPQKNFWCALPGLIAAGFVFTFQPLVNLIKNRGSRDGYKQEL